MKHTVASVAVDVQAVLNELIVAFGRDRPGRLGSMAPEHNPVASAKAIGPRRVNPRVLTASTFSGRRHRMNHVIERTLSASDPVRPGTGVPSLPKLELLAVPPALAMLRFHPRRYVTMKLLQFHITRDQSIIGFLSGKYALSTRAALQNASLTGAAASFKIGPFSSRGGSFMEADDIRSEVKETIAEVLDLDDDVDIVDSTTASDVPRWDSLRHVRIILSIERKFKIRFDESEVQSLKSAGDLFSMVAIKVAAKS